MKEIMSPAFKRIFHCHKYLKKIPPLHRDYVLPSSDANDNSEERFSRKYWFHLTGESGSL
jgi:hypothetical protein